MKLLIMCKYLLKKIIYFIKYFIKYTMNNSITNFTKSAKKNLSNAFPKTKQQKIF